MRPIIGIIGGMGPLATAIFLKKVIDVRNAKKDQDNIPLTIINDTTVPDRTAYLLGESKESPFPHLLSDLKDLEMLGCKYAAMICNTSHSFYDELRNSTTLDIVNMPKITLEEVSKRGYSKPGLMATEGTIKTKVYEKFNDYGLDIVLPSADIQKVVNSLIYNYVKKNIPVPKEKFANILDYFKNIGCDSIILGCTELSAIIDDLKIDENYIIDSTTELAKKIINIYNDAL